MLILICGHSRAGKTTLSHVFDSAYHVVHTDDVGYAGALREAAKYHDVVVEGLYFTPNFRKHLAATHDACKCIYVDTPKDVRDARRGHVMKHDVKFMIPTCSEGWDEVYRYHVGKFDLIERR